jgi:hypothetical protein
MGRVVEAIEQQEQGLRGDPLDIMAIVTLT